MLFYERGTPGGLIHERVIHEISVHCVGAGFGVWGSGFGVWGLGDRRAVVGPSSSGI